MYGIAAAVVKSILAGISDWSPGLFADVSPGARWQAFALWMIISASIGAFVIFGAQRQKASEPRPAETTKQSVTVTGQPAQEPAKPAQTIASPVQIGKIAQSGSVAINAPVINAPITVNGEKVNLTINFPSQTDTVKDNKDFSYKVAVLNVETDHGDKAKLTVYMLYDSAAWRFGSSSELKNYSRNKPVSLSEFLDSSEFSKDVQDTDAIVCLGLASALAKGDIQQTVALSDARATYLCGAVSRRIHEKAGCTEVFGIPLGYNRNANVEQNTEEERKQRSVVILGIRETSGVLSTDEGHKKIVSLMLEQGIVDNFRFGDYSEVAPGNPLHYLMIKRCDVAQK